MLKETSKEIHYPEIDADYLNEIYAAFLTSGRPEGSQATRTAQDGLTALNLPVRGNAQRRTEHAS